MRLRVGTKTKQQCILYFVQMKIEDSFLDGEDSNNAGNSHHIVDPVLSIKNSLALNAVQTSKKKNKSMESSLCCYHQAHLREKMQYQQMFAKVTGDDFANNLFIFWYLLYG